jgi:hypothetical protein
MTGRSMKRAPAREPRYCGSSPRRIAALLLVLAAILATTRPTLARIGQGPGASREADLELKRALAAVQKVTDRSIQTLRSEHFQAVGDASESFLKITLGDCERIAEGYFAHFRAKGFLIQNPDRRLTLLAFVDERPFRILVKGAPAAVSGLYNRTDNWLILFDFRNFTSQDQRRGYQANMWTLAHEATHLLAYNTGLLNRNGDVPRAISEGIATYCEARKLKAESEPGKINSMRLDDLAHIQRRVKWISVAELITNEKAAFGATEERMLLAYAESWLLVHHLMTTPSRLPQFRDYLKAISRRTDAEHRLQDAEASFASLDRLDRDVRQEAIQLQQKR